MHIFLRKLLFITPFLWCVLPASAADYVVDITAPTALPAPVDALLKQHLEIIKLRDNPRATPAEWLRVYRTTPTAIEDLLATEGYFSATITPSIEVLNGTSHAQFLVDIGEPSLIQSVDLQFSGSILGQATTNAEIEKFNQAWLLKTGMPFRQEDWTKAKRQLLIAMLVQRYPNANITSSKAQVNPETKAVTLLVEVDSGTIFKFGELQIEGLKRYPASIIKNLNYIKPGTEYSHARLQAFQARLEESGYFRGVEVTANTTDVVGDIVPIKVVVTEGQSAKLGIGAGYSTNTLARAQLSYSELNLFDRGWQLTSSLKVAQKEQVLNGLIRLPTKSSGYRDSLSANVNREVIEGQTTTASQFGVNRSWGPRKREQTVGTNYLVEQRQVDGVPTETKRVATVSYGITLRRTDNDRNPTLGYLFNAQFAVAPIEQLSSGRFVQSYVKAQGYYPITTKTQLIARAEIGAVSGKNSAPEAFLFRAGGDQSVRGYGYQSLGVAENDATVGARYLATGSVEVIQWLTEQWGAAAFVDFGNAANTLTELKPVYGYGLGARWKSPIGAIGADIAYGEAVDEYRVHFNLGVAF